MTGVAVIEGEPTIAEFLHLRKVEAIPALPEEADLVRELHDGVAQDLATMLLDLEHFRRGQTGRQGVQAQITLLQEQLRTTLTGIRHLIYDRRSMPGVERDFTGTIRRGYVKRWSARTGIEVKVSVSRSWPDLMPAEAARNLHRIVQESMANVARHSGATKASIRFDVDLQRRTAVVTVRDNGRGLYRDEEWRAGLGLLGIEERAVLLGASARVENARSGGCKLTVVLPLSTLAAAS